MCRCAGQSHSVDQARVHQGIAGDELIALKEGRECSDIGLIPAGEENAVCGAEMLGERALSFAMDGKIACHEARCCGPPRDRRLCGHRLSVGVEALVIGRAVHCRWFLSAQGRSGQVVSVEIVSREEGRRGLALVGQSVALEVSRAKSEVVVAAQPDDGPAIDAVVHTVSRRDLGQPTQLSLLLEIGEARAETFVEGVRHVCVAPASKRVHVEQARDVCSRPRALACVLESGSSLMLRVCARCLAPHCAEISGRARERELGWGVVCFA